MQLTYLMKTRTPVVAEITPDLTAEDARQMKVYYGKREKMLQDLFAVADDGKDTITITNPVPTARYIGRGMTRGEIAVEGDAGMHLGAEMKGGRITVKGNVSDWAGAEMKGGEIVVEGNAGHRVGGAYRGSECGMDRGFIMVRGSAGNETGALMKRGIIVIGKDAGAFTGCGMKGGTVFCFGKGGERTGAFMERGSVVMYGRTEVLPTFHFNAVYSPTWLRVFLLELKKRESTLVKDEYITGSYRRYTGDLSELGKGEILMFEG